MSAYSWHARLLLLAPRRVQATLDAAAERGWPEPSLWQLEVGALRMWHRTVFRSATIGTCTAHAVRDTRRARALQWRPLRFPFLLAEHAVAPWDMSGLFSTPERLTRHLLGAHHDAHQFIYDVQVLSLTPGAVEGLHERVRAVVNGTDPHSEWLRDLCVYEGYHEMLLDGVEAFLAGAVELSPADAEDADTSFIAYLDWCSRQPATPRETWRAWRTGTFGFPHPTSNRPAM